MRRRRLGALLVLAPLLALSPGCAGPPPPARPPAAPAPAPPPEPRELESPVAPERERELRRQAEAALRETQEVLAGLGAEGRRERSQAVAAVEALVAESRQALAEDEVERAQNLAAKALALAREL